MGRSEEDLLNAVDAVDAYLRGRRRAPLSKRVALPPAKDMELFEQITSAIPEEYRQARFIIRDRDQILADQGVELPPLEARPFDPGSPETTTQSLALLVDGFATALDPRSSFGPSVRRMVDADAACEALGRLRAGIPLRLADARAIVSQREEILAAARRGERIGPAGV